MPVNSSYRVSIDDSYSHGGPLGIKANNDNAIEGDGALKPVKDPLL